MYASPNPAQNGFTLIEVLVSILLLSLGMLGLAGLQVSALKSGHGSYLKNQATALSYEIAERIRSNRGAVEAGHYDIGATELPATNPDCENSSCSTHEMAHYDLNEWKNTITMQLPAGDGAIRRNGELITVELYWDERRNGATGTGCDPDNADDLACFDMSFVP